VNGAETSRPTLREWLKEAPFALAMSSGFFGFFAHAGVLASLEDAGLLPNRVSGSSAGALVTGAWAAGVDSRAFARELFDLRREEFWDPAIGVGLLRGSLFRARLDSLLPAHTFAECRVPASISVFDLFASKTRVIDHGPIAPAIQASCALPFLFHPVWIGRRPYIDGGVADRPGLAGIPQGARILLHHLASRSGRRAPSQKEIPRRHDMKVVTFPEVPRVGPFKLHVGRAAFDHTRVEMDRALDNLVTP
jgi:NTE family protein